jgi:hypothetical protein
MRMHATVGGADRLGNERADRLMTLAEGEPTTIDAVPGKEGEALRMFSSGSGKQRCHPTVAEENGALSSPAESGRRWKLRTAGRRGALKFLGRPRDCPKKSSDVIANRPLRLFLPCMSIH